MQKVASRCRIVPELARVEHVAHAREQRRDSGSGTPPSARGRCAPRPRAIVSASRRVGRERLLAQHVLAGLERADGPLGVQRVRAADCRWPRSRDRRAAPRSCGWTRGMPCLRGEASARAPRRAPRPPRRSPPPARDAPACSSAIGAMRAAPRMPIDGLGPVGDACAGYRPGPRQAPAAARSCGRTTRLANTSSASARAARDAAA